MKRIEAQNDVNFFLFFNFFSIHFGFSIYFQLGIFTIRVPKRTIKNYFGCLLHLLFHDYNGLVSDYN
jgi:hypothetical protein